MIWGQTLGASGNTQADYGTGNEKSKAAHGSLHCFCRCLEAIFSINGRLPPQNPASRVRPIGNLTRSHSRVSPRPERARESLSRINRVGKRLLGCGPPLTSRWLPIGAVSPT